MNLAAALLLAAEEHHPNGKMLPGDLNELWWAIVAFIAIAALLYKLAYPAIVKGLHGRTAKIESELGVAEAARAEALAEAEAIRASVADADSEADRIVAESHETAAQLGVSLRKRADNEAVDLRHRAAADIESQKAQAIADLQAEVAALAQGAAEAVVRHNLDAATQTALIDRYIDQVGVTVTTEPINDRVELFADALFRITQASANPSEVEDELFRLSRVIDGNDELRTRLTDTTIPASRRQQIVEELLKERATPVTTAIVSLLVSADRAADLPRIVESMLMRSASASNRSLAEVRSAVPLTTAQETRLAVALEKQLGRPVQVRVIVDPSVVGGIVTQIGDTVIDGSIRTRLAQLRDAFRPEEPK